MDNETTKTPMKMKQARIKKLAKQDWIERMKWIKQINHVQTLTKTVNEEFD